MTRDTASADFLVLGSGIAGLRAALGLARHGTVLVVTKDQPTESNTGYAQGGVAAAVGADDRVELHLEDTVAAGAGIVSRAAARVLVEEGPERIRELSAWGARFDREVGRLHFTREGAHSRDRILHARGDSTGWEMVRALLERTRRTERIEVRSFACSTDLAVRDGHVVGCRFLGDDETETTVLARATLLATGGAGMVFSETTNPAVATGDGMAMGLRAGAALLDMEFVQFHPTALAVPGAPRFLISEALRGEGAYLRNAGGERFTEELAPRDQVARAIARESREGRGPVTLDLRHLDAERVRTRFPRIAATCARYGIDIAHDPIPVTPAAHYACGGVVTDVDGRTSVRGLYAAGEVARTGLHGANRLASNSLAEALVFGRRAALADDGVLATPQPMDALEAGPAGAMALATIRERADRFLGVRRDGPELDKLAAEIVSAADPGGGRAATLVAWLMTGAASRRTESRGGHFRVDHPAPDPAWAVRQVVDHRGWSTLASPAPV